MKYNVREFDKAVSYYRKELKRLVKRNHCCLVELPLGNKEAFYSVAPLGRALHELNAEMNLFVIDRKSESLKAMKRIWEAYSGKDPQKKTALLAFIASVNRKTKSKEFRRVFRPPELEIAALPNGFTANGTELEFRTKWFRERKWKGLLATCRRILTQGYNLGKRERLSVSFELIPKKKDLQLPLDDYLDNFSIAYAMALSGKKLCRRVSLGSSTTKMSQLAPLNRISDLAATLVGCEYEKNIPEPWFREFRKLSRLLHLERLKPSGAAFGIHGRGYGGKHFFGMKIGYPTPNRKSRWQGPGQMFMKPFWVEQTRLDSREPKTRYAITGTLPIENFIRTCNIDYFKLRKKHDRIREVLKQGKTLHIKGRQLKQGRTELEVDLSRILKKKSPVLASDIEVNTKTPKEAAEIFRINSGRYGNFPGGEVFWTPYDFSGTYIGDVVINVDQSYVIGAKNPLVIKIKRGRYRIRSGPKKILEAIERRKSESRKLIGMLEKNRSVPKREIKTFRRNFDRVGEMAINTNPRARLSRYLIETEKLARMMHIALGSGYEPGRETTYHCDIVLNCPRQKVDMWVVTPKKEILWIMKKGKLVV